MKPLANASRVDTLDLEDLSPEALSESHAMQLRALRDNEIDRSVREIRLLGYSVLPNVLPRPTVKKLLNLVGTLSESAAPLGEGSGVSANQALDKYVYHLQFKNRMFLDILTEWQGGLDIIKPFLNDPYYRQLPDDECNFVLGYYNARSSVAELALHIDNYVPTLGAYPNSMQVVFSLNGQDAKNGATCVVPGSHLKGSFPDRDLPGIARPLYCSAGDVIVWDSRLWHGAAANQTGADRWSLVATFRPWFLKQNCDPSRGMSEELYATLSQQQKAILGFLSLPPTDCSERVNLKQGYDSLRGILQKRI